MEKGEDLQIENLRRDVKTNFCGRKEALSNQEESQV